MNDHTIIIISNNMFNIFCSSCFSTVSINFLLDLSQFLKDLINYYSIPLLDLRQERCNLFSFLNQIHSEQSIHLIEYYIEFIQLR